MKAIVFKEDYLVAVEKVDDPKIENSKDAIIKVTSTAICGSDLHMYEGRTQMPKNQVFGHEIMGIVKSIGSAVSSIKVGDRVVLPFNIACGCCFNCNRGYTNACLIANPTGVGAAYGYANMGPYQGGQAELVRVPFADFNCLKLPGEPGDKYEADFLMLADVFPTGYHACMLAKVEAGSSVAIFGAGPVGLLAAHSAFILGASQVYVVDQSKERLKLAKKIGATPINFLEGDPVQQIKDIRKKDSLISDAFRPGEEKMQGVMCGIDAVGYQSLNIHKPQQEDPTSVLRMLIKLVNPTGNIGIVGVYMPEDPKGQGEKGKKGIYDLPLGEIFSKGLTLATGQTPVKKYNAYLRDLIIAGIAKPSFIVSDTVRLSKGPGAYEKFACRGLGKGSDCTKVILEP